MPMIDLCPFMDGAVAEVLEAMCFISVEETSKDVAEQFQQDWICGELDFTGDISGTFCISAPPSTAATIAANFLGEEVGLTLEVTKEVLCEFTNMVCGTLLAQTNNKSVFTLSPPRSDCHGIVSSDQCKRIYRIYALDEGCIHAWIEVKAVA